MSVIAVTGYFKDEKFSQILEFSRTFVLEKIKDMEYKICNDLLQIKSITKEANVK